MQPFCADSMPVLGLTLVSLSVYTQESPACSSGFLLFVVCVLFGFCVFFLLFGDSCKRLFQKQRKLTYAFPA